MRNSYIVLFLMCLMPLNAQNVIHSSTGKWEVEIQNNGVIKSLKMDFGGKMMDVPWHSKGDYAGPSFEMGSVQKTDKFTYERKRFPFSHAIKYAEENGNLTISLSVRNNSGKIQMIEKEASFRIGINSIMDDPKSYFSIFFPTLLRCEKTHFWGYFQSPNGQVLAIASPDPVASWHIDYIGNGHRVATAGLDLLHKLPLPERHPQHLYCLAPEETKEWKLVLLPLSGIDKVPEAIGSVCKVPMINLLRTTASPGETVDFSVFGCTDSEPAVSVFDPSGEKIAAEIVRRNSGEYGYSLQIPERDGTYKIIAEKGGLQSEASIYVRKSWSWYLEQAGKEALRVEQKTASHREAWLGFFSAYWSHVYAPDSKKLEETEQRFNAFWEKMVDPKTGFFYTNKETWHVRPQNTSWMVGLLVARYAATNKVEHLELAANWADYLIDRFQLPNGAYKGYTALTMGSKFIQELMWYEAPLAKKDKKWDARYKKHYNSVQAAAKNVLTVKDLGDTEGESTYEDNQAGTAWSLLAMHALTHPSGSDFDHFFKESLAIQKRHECLTQALIPDSRMRGGTLRWWEAQYDVLIKRNMMNSPHGWTMRSQFGALYLYLLTGEEYYLNVAFNAMGACSQAVDHRTGELRWAFVPDPYMKIERFVQDYKEGGEGKYVDEVIGEQWIPMISNWWLVAEDEVPTNNQRGWACDNDVHEHFRFLAEQFIPNAFVIERADGTIRSWNCSAQQEGGRLIVTPAEEVVTRIHFNLQQKHVVEVKFSKNTQQVTVNKGMQWVGPGLTDYKTPAVYLWPEMISTKYKL